MPLFRRRRGRVRVLDEAEAYARCHGDRGRDVRIVHMEVERRRGFPVTITGEEIRLKLVEKMRAREHSIDVE